MLPFPTNAPLQALCYHSCEIVPLGVARECRPWNDDSYTVIDRQDYSICLYLNALKGCPKVLRFNKPSFDDQAIRFDSQFS